MGNPITFNPILLDQPKISSRQIINQLPSIHQTDTLQKFFGSSVNHLFNPGQGKQINGYIGQQPLWYNPTQDFYLTEPTASRTFYQLEASMTSKNADGEVTNLLFYPDIINQLRFQGAITTNHDRLFEQNYYSWCPPINLDMLLNFRQYYWLETLDQKIDYLVMQRDCADRNPWSFNNLWYHSDDLTDDQRSIAIQAKRPIVEFQKNLELFNYGTSRRRDIYDIVDKQNFTDIITTANLIGVSVIYFNNYTFDVLNKPIRILVTNDVNPNLNNQIYYVSYSNNLISVNLETDGIDLSGGPVKGEIVYVEKTNKEVYFNGSNWVQAQVKENEQKDTINIAPLFNLYDINNVALNDQSVYPFSTFAGNKLFSYDVNSSNTGVIDSILNIPLTFDKNGQINFQNYLASERYTYVLGQTTQSIDGFYFHKTNNGSDADYSNDWFSVNSPSRQLIVDQFICDGINQIFDISQMPDLDVAGEPPNLIVQKISKTSNATSDYSSQILVQNVDYVVFNTSVMLKTSTASDIVKIKTYSSKPFSNASGFYEVAPNLQANPANKEISLISTGDYTAHFSEVMQNQIGFIGQTYSSNNWRNISHDLSKGKSIVQHSASLLPLALTLSQSQLNFMNAARYVEAEYVRFRNKYEQKILQYYEKGNLTSNSNITDVVISALKEISKGKTQTFPFASNGVASTSIPSFIPATPSYLGMYPLYLPLITSDITFNAEFDDVTATFMPRTVIQNHDGSLTPTYGTYQVDSNGVLTSYSLDYQKNVVLSPKGSIDPRDQSILQLETNIYNSVNENIAAYERPLFDYQVHYSTYSRSVDYSYQEFLSLLQPAFDRWVSQHNLNYKANTTFDENNVFTWNWSQVFGIDGNLLPGSWRGIALYYFETDRPHTNPWEMLGFSSKPSYWDSTYGVAPYTSNNFNMWNDLEKGYIASGNRAGINAEWARKDLSKYIPVDEEGNLLDPVQMGIAQDYPLLSFAKQDWKFGDCGPVETAWRRSSLFGFAAVQAGYLMKPARFFGALWDTSNSIKVGDQIIDKSTRNRPLPSQLTVHGEKTDNGSVVIKYGLQQWISEYIVSLNQNVTTTFGNLVRGLDVQLAYKIAGFTNTKSLFVSSDAFDRVPPEDVNVQLYQSPSIREEFYGAVVVSYNGQYFSVYGYDILNPVFKVIPPNIKGPYSQVVFGSAQKIAVRNWKPGDWYAVSSIVNHIGLYYQCLRNHTSSQIFEDVFWQEISKPTFINNSIVNWYSNSVNNNAMSVPYGSQFGSLQEVANFLNGLERYYISRGWSFNLLINNGADISNWYQSCYEFLAWFHDNQSNINSFIILNPAAKQIVFETIQGEPQSVEQFVNGAYNLINRSSKPIRSNTVDIARSNGQLIITPTNAVDGGIYGCRIYINELEHVVLFNNTTIFNDVIFNPLLNIRQPRLRLQGFKTINWLGRINAPGFMVTGNTLTPNFEKSADDFRRLFDIETVDDDSLQERARNNIGYYERDYLSNLLLTPTNQFEFYQGMIQHKGTPSVMDRLLRSNFIRNNRDIKFLEEWAFRVGDYGNVQVNPSFDLQLKQSEVTTNPQLIRFNVVSSVDGAPTPQNNVIDIVDVQGNNPTRDSHWLYRDTTFQVNWQTKQFKQKTLGFLPNTGYVDVNDVSWTTANYQGLIGLYYDTLNNNPSTVITNSYDFEYDGISLNPSNVKVAIVPNFSFGYIRINKIEFNVTESFVTNAMAINVGRSASPMEFARASSDVLSQGYDTIFRPSALFECNSQQDNTVYLNFEYGFIAPLGANIGKVTITISAEQFTKSVLPNHRVLVYQDRLNDWSTYKLQDTGNIINQVFVPSFVGQGAPVSFIELTNGLTSNSLLLLDGVGDSVQYDASSVFDSAYNPVFNNVRRLVINQDLIATSNVNADNFAELPIMGTLSDAGMVIDLITVTVIQPFLGGTTAPQLQIGLPSDNDLYVKSYTPTSEFIADNPQVVNQPLFSANLAVALDIYDTTVSVAESTTLVPVQIVRSGNIFRTLTSINITNPGQNYVSPPIVVVSGPQGIQASAVMAGPVNQILITNGGSGYTTTPIVTIVGANGLGAFATASIQNNQVTSITVVVGGSGYTTQPTVIISGGGGVGASATASVNLGVDSVVVTSTGGCLYNGTDTPAVAFVGGGGTGTTATAQFSDPLPEMSVNWRYYRNTPNMTGWVEGGVATFTTVDNPLNVDSHLNDYWLQTIQVPVQSPETNTSIYQVEIYSADLNNSLYSIGQNIATITVVKTQLDSNSVDLTVAGTTTISGGEVPSNETLYAYLNPNGSTGIATINISYHYEQGFEVFNVDGTPKITTDPQLGGRLLSWIPTRFSSLQELSSTIVPNGWYVNDIVEVDYNPNVLSNGGWAVYQYQTSVWNELRRETLKVDSSQFVNAVIYNNETNDVLQRLQLFDPYQGHIVGTADRELTYKENYDPAVYNNSSTAFVPTDQHHCWGSTQLGQLWWDLSTVRYIDYNISTPFYRWKNWGRLAPGISVDVYEWIRSPVSPIDWNLFLANSTTYVGFSTTPQTGEVTDPDNMGWVEQQEWIPALNRKVTAYYFWLKNVANLPAIGGRKLSAVQVASIIANPDAQDIPWFAAIDSNQLIVGGIKQYLNDTNTVLKLNWKIDGNDGNHHKQWKIIREDDDTSIIDLSLWNKMRDSLVGWDNFKTVSTQTAKLTKSFNKDDDSIFVDDDTNLLPIGELFFSNSYVSYTYKHNNVLYGINNSSNITGFVDTIVSQYQSIDNPKTVPDPMLTKAEANGNLVRPRQSWFPVDKIHDVVVPSRYARQVFVEEFNVLMQESPFLDEWYQWQSVFNSIDPVPNTNEYTISAPSMLYRNQLSINNTISIGQIVFVPSDAANNNFWTLWRYDPDNPKADDYGYVIQRAQKWRFLQGEVWNPTDWYAEDFSSNDFPQIHYPDRATFLAAPPPADTTLLKGTLVAIDTQSTTDQRWSWELFQNGVWTQVAKQNSAVLLSNTFFDPNKVLYGFQSYDLTTVPIRDGSWELRFLLDTIPVTLFTKTQMNSLFFSMTKCALSMNKDVDWVIKTSFMSIGGYTEPLKQVPLAYADQISNIVSYIEEVKPYHVKIRNYALQYTVGPDPVNAHITDFDSSTAEYSLAASTANVVCANKTLDQQLAQAKAVALNKSAIPITDTPFLDVQDSNTSDWNGLRHVKTRMLFDRISCKGVAGWDNKPWDYETYSYTANNKGDSTSTVLAPDYLNIKTNVHYNSNLCESIPSAWDVDLNPDAALRIDLSYSPSPEMDQKDYDGLINGCGYRGVINDGGPFTFGLWDNFAWDFEGGWSNEDAYYDGSIDENKFVKITPPANNPTPVSFNSSGSWDKLPWDPLKGWDNESIGASLTAPTSTEANVPTTQTINVVDKRPGDLSIIGNVDNTSVIEIDGGRLSQPEIQSGHPEELVLIRLYSSILVKYKDSQVVLLDYHNDD